MSSLPSHVSNAAAPTSQCKTRLHATSSRQGAKSKPPKKTSKPRQKSKCDAFRKGVTPMAPPSHVQRGSGFHPWMIVLEGKTTPPTEKAAPNWRRRRHSFRPRNPLARTSGQEGRPQANNTAIAVVPPPPTEVPSEGRRRAEFPKSESTF